MFISNKLFKPRRPCNSPVYCEEIVKTNTCNSPARLHSQTLHFYPSWSFEHYKSYHSRQAQPEDIMRKKKIKTNALHSTSINNHVVLLHNHGNSTEKFQSIRFTICVKASLNYQTPNNFYVSKCMIDEKQISLLIPLEWHHCFQSLQASNLSRRKKYQEYDKMNDDIHKSNFVLFTIV